MGGGVELVLNLFCSTLVYPAFYFLIGKSKTLSTLFPGYGEGNWEGGNLEGRQEGEGERDGMSLDIWYHLYAGTAALVKGKKGETLRNCGK